MRKYLALFIKPAIFAFLVTKFWEIFCYYHPTGEEAQVSSSIATGFFAFSLFLPGLIVNEAFKDYKQTKAVLQQIKRIYADTKQIDQDLKKRLGELNDMRIPGLLYAVIGMIALISVKVTGMIDFHSFQYGQEIIFLTSYIKYLLFICAYELDDPFTGRFRADGMPVELEKACKEAITVRKHEKIAKILF